MDLIDRDEMRMIVYTTERCNGKTALAKAISTIITDAPTVNAIPIEWLRQKQNEHANDGFEWIYDEIINEWEQEKQNE